MNHVLNTQCIMLVKAISDLDDRLNRIWEARLSKDVDKTESARQIMHLMYEKSKLLSKLLKVLDDINYGDVINLAQHRLIHDLNAKI